MELDMFQSALELAGLGQKRITAVVSDRVSRAFLLEGDIRMMALEANAHPCGALLGAPRRGPHRCRDAH
jgi:hypothetical protein